MSEYINRQTLLEEIQRQKSASKSSYPKQSFVVGDVLNCIKNAPSEKVEKIVLGKWEVSEIDYVISPVTLERVISPKYKCSNCGYKTGKQAENFVCCPICTARMNFPDD